MDEEMYAEDDLDMDDEDVMELDPYEEDDGDADAEEEIEEMLEALMEGEDAGDEDLAERRRRRRRRFRSRRARRRPVRTAQGRSAYRAPVSGRYVNQKQLKDAMDRVGRDVRRNALGIKSVNKRVGRVDARVNGVVSANRVQSRHINTLQRQARLDGALEFAASYDGTAVDVFQLLKGAVKSGMLDSTKGALANPLVIGGLGLLLKNPGVIGGLLARPSS